MQTGINPNLLKNFILSKVGASMTKNEANELGMEKNFKTVADELDVNEIDLNDIIDSELYEDFATMYVQDRDDKRAAKDEETEKQEQLKVQDKNGAGV